MKSEENGMIEKFTYVVVHTCSSSPVICSKLRWKRGWRVGAVMVPPMSPFPSVSISLELRVLLHLQRTGLTGTNYISKVIIPPTLVGYIWQHIETGTRMQQNQLPMFPGGITVLLEICGIWYKFPTTSRLSSFSSFLACFYYFCSQDHFSTKSHKNDSCHRFCF